MHIHEAIAATTAQKPYVTRRAGGYITDHPCSAPVKLLVSDSPNGCIIRSEEDKPRCGWRPTAGDLVADDWESVR